MLCHSAFSKKNCIVSVNIDEPAAGCTICSGNLSLKYTQVFMCQPWWQEAPEVIVDLSLLQWWNVTKYIYLSTILSYFFVEFFHFLLLYPSSFKYCTFCSLTFIWYLQSLVTPRITCCIRAKVEYLLHSFIWSTITLIENCLIMRMLIINL